MVLKLAENRLVGLAQDVYLDVETSPVGHPQYDLLHARVRTVVQEIGEGGHHHFRPFGGETLLAQVPGMEELFEKTRPAELLPDPPPGFSIEDRPISSGFHPVLEPSTLVGVLQVHVLDPDRAAVGFPEHPQDLFQRGLLHARKMRGKEDPFEVLVAQAHTVRVQERMAGRA